MSARWTSSPPQFAPRPAAPRSFCVVLRSRAIPRAARFCFAIKAPAGLRRPIARLAKIFGATAGAPAIDVRPQASSAFEKFPALIAFAPDGLFAYRKLDRSPDWPYARAA